MIQATATRLSGVVPRAQILIVTGSQYASLVSDQLPFLSEGQVILEPAGRNTAPAIGLAAIRTQQLNPNAVLALLHSDHVIPDQEAFQEALVCAAEVARSGHIVTLGIRPTCPHTGYGYIERGNPLSPIPPVCSQPVYSVVQFLEKPDWEVAEAFLAGGAHYWNAGIFVAPVDLLLAEYKRQLPELYSTLIEISRVLDGSLPDSEANSAFEELWKGVAAISFDHGIMEGADGVAVVPLDAGWSDVGSWEALEEVLPNTDANLVVSGNLVSIESSANIVSSQRALVALIGVHDLVVVDSGDALLIGRKDEMQRVKEVVDILASEGYESLL